LFRHSLADDSVCRLTYLDNRLGSVSESHGEEYAPVAAYRHSLLMGEVDTTVQSTKLAAPTAGAKRRGAKRKLIADGESYIASNRQKHVLKFLLTVCRYQECEQRIGYRTQYKLTTSKEFSLLKYALTHLYQSHFGHVLSNLHQYFYE